MTDTVLPLYLRWLQERIAPRDSERPVAILSRTKRHATAILDRVFDYRSRHPRRHWHLYRHLYKSAGHTRRSFEGLRGKTFFYALILDADLLRTKLGFNRFSALTRAVLPCFSRDNGHAVIIVGDSSRHPRSTFACMAHDPPCPLPEPSSEPIVMCSRVGSVPYIATMGRVARPVPNLLTRPQRAALRILGAKVG